MKQSVEPRNENLGHSGRLFWRVVTTFLTKYWLSLVMAFLFMWVVGVASSAQTYLMKPLIDKVFLHHDYRMLWIIGGGLVSIFIARAIARYAQELLLITVGQKIVAEAQTRLFDNLLKQDLAEVKAQNSGAVAARFTFDANTMRAAVCDVFLASGKDSITVVSMIAVLFFQNWRLALVTVALPIIAFLPVKYLGRGVRFQSLRMQVETGALSRVLTRAFRGIKTVRSFKTSRIEEERFDRSATALTDAVIRSAWLGGAILPIVDALAGLSLGVVVVVGGYQVIAGSMTPGGLFVFVSALVGAYAPIPSLSKVNVKLQTGLAAAQRIFSVLDETAFGSKRDQDLLVSRDAGAIVLDSVSFAYDRAQPVVKAINLVAEAGKVTAIVGQAGAGKTTVLNLMARLIEPQTGSIRINGCELACIRSESLYDALTLVSQDCPILDDTIANNLRCGQLNVSDVEIIRVAAQVGLWAFIERLPQGLETMIGRHGLHLSSGQRQKLALARALIRDTPIILLDETTNAQDGLARSHLRLLLRGLLKGRTVVIVSHELADVAGADFVYVVEAGEVVQSGSHEALITQEGPYARLFEPGWIGRHAAEDLQYV